MAKFKDSMKVYQIKWRREHLPNQERGKQNAGWYDHVLPWHQWQLNLWPEISGESKNSISSYLKDERIRKHNGSHNLLSSWILCANLYFPFRNEGGRKLLAGFLRETVTDQIVKVESVELEHAFKEYHLTPNFLLGETDGGRGAGQTSPDVAFEVETSNGPGVILVECKFTEHNFYPCSGRKKKSTGRPPNPNVSRCFDFLGVLQNPSEQCHLCAWERKYWDHLEPIVDVAIAASLKRCPAATGGYQLFRQHALAEGLANTDEFELIVSSVAYDYRNQDLMKCMARSTGIDDISTKWKKLFAGKAEFITFTHQDWVMWVAENGQMDSWGNWLSYISERYDL